MLTLTKHWITETQVQQLYIINSCLTRLLNYNFLNQILKLSTLKTNFRTKLLYLLKMDNFLSNQGTLSIPTTLLYLIKMDNFLNNQWTLSIPITITSSSLTVNKIICFPITNLTGSNKATPLKIPNYLSVNPLKLPPITSTTNFKLIEHSYKDFKTLPRILQWMYFSTHNTIKWYMRYKRKKRISKIPINSEWRIIFSTLMEVCTLEKQLKV